MTHSHVFQIGGGVDTKHKILFSVPHDPGQHIDDRDPPTWPRTLQVQLTIHNLKILHNCNQKVQKSKTSPNKL